MANESLANAVQLCFVFSAAMALLSLWQASAVMADVPIFESGPSLWVQFAQTSYGRFGLASFAALTIGAVFQFWSRFRARSVMSTAVSVCILVFVAVCRVATGHAAENGIFSMAAAVELIHIVSMALWVGSVLTAAWVVCPKFGKADTGLIPSHYLASLSKWATVSLAG